MRTGVPAVALLVALATLVGCAQEATTLERSETERAVQRVIGGRITVPIDRIRCPAVIERGSGRRSVCQAVLSDGAGEVRVRVTQGEDDALEVGLLDAVLDRAAVSEDLRRTLVETYRRSFAVVCAEPDILIAAPGSTFTCRVDDGDERRDIEVAVVDATGTVSYDVGA